MPKPFPRVLTFPYTPRWGGNRQRETAEQFTVTLRDLTTVERLDHQAALQELLEKNGYGADGVPREGANPIVYARASLEKQCELVALRFVSVTGLSIEVGNEGGAVREIFGFEPMLTYCPDLVLELASRLLAGPDGEEAKN